MFRIIEVVFILLVGIGLIIMTFLFNGVEIDNILYKNINIKKLYLKYDKKLNISISEIVILNKESRKSTKMSAILTVDYNNHLFEIDIEKFHIFNTDIKVKGLVYIDKNKIDFDDKSSVIVEDLLLTFDKKMKEVKAKKAFIEYQNDTINISFDKPYYGDISVEDSKIAYLLKESTLQLYLKTKSLFNDTLKKALLRYGVEISTIQYDGINDISAKIFIPFDKGDLFIESNVVILNSTIEDYGVKFKVDKTTLYYRDKILKGQIYLNHLEYKGVDISNSVLNYTLDFNKGLSANIDSKKVTIQKDQNIFYLDQLLFQFKDNNIIVKSNIKDSMDKLAISITNHTDLTKKELFGSFAFKYDDKKYNALVTSDNIKYKGNFQENFKVSVIGEKIDILKPKKNTIKNFSLHFNDNIISTKLLLHDEYKKYIIEILNKTNLIKKELSGNFTLKYDDKEHNVLVTSDNIKYKGDFQENFKVSVIGEKIDILKPKKNTIKNFSLHFNDNIISTNLLLHDEYKKYIIEILNKTNLAKKDSYGKIFIKNIFYEGILKVNNKNIPYHISFKDDIVINSPTFGLTYFKKFNSSKQKLKISNPSKLLDTFTFITVDKKSSGFINIETNDFQGTVILINNLNFDIDSTPFQSKEEDKKIKDKKKTENLVLPLFPKIDLSYTNSTIKYDDLSFAFDTLNLKTDNNTLDLKVKKDSSLLDLQTKDNGVIFHAEHLSDKYINNFLNKDIFKDGYIDIHIYGEDINELSGDINLHKTTVKNVTIVNSLLTFINTTPAIINPLLALPTFFRMMETDFDTNGYYMKKGKGSFRYNLPKQQLDIYDLYTKGKMSNFIVNSHLDLKTKKIDANVDISFLKDFSKALNHIPVVGYLIMGEDGKFHTSVDITGTTEDPKIETHTVKEASRGVTGIIKRVLTLPLQPFQIETTEEEKKEHNKRVEKLLK